MRSARRGPWLVAIAALLVGCATDVTPTGDPSRAPAAPQATRAPSVALADPPVTLRLAVADGSGAPSEPAIEQFVREVADRSAGNITVAPTFEAGKGMDPGFEVGVAGLVQRGETDLALVAARAWDLVGVTSLEALQSPYLIDDDALEVEVARSDIAQRALEAMGTGVVGLTMWPEDLRHLFSFPTCPKDFRSPDGVRGAVVLVAASRVTEELRDALGALPYVEDDRHLDSVSCKLEGQEAGLSQLKAVAQQEAIAVGNVTLFPKYQVLVANQEAFEHLSAGQRAVLRDAAAAVREQVITGHPTDAALAVAWCAQGGSVIVASPEEVQAFVPAADPVYARLETDPLTKQLIVDIRALKASMPPAAGTDAKPCAGDNAFVPAPTLATSDGVGYSGEVPPDGTFRAELTFEGLVAQGATDEWAGANAGVWTWTFRDGRYHYIDQNDLACDGTLRSVEGRFFHLELDAGQSANCVGGDFLWKEEADGIRLATLHMPEDTSARDFWDVYRWLDRVWVRID